jgi:hypothetical protein
MAEIPVPLGERAAEDGQREDVLLPQREQLLRDRRGGRCFLPEPEGCQGFPLRLLVEDGLG